ncbi:MAG: discoidin domain-containing protein [Bacteroidales bacterium]|nr:discoidin domain-containing protein [Bacteroidales bacterium]
MDLLLAQDITTDSIYSSNIAPVGAGSTIILQDRVLEYQINLTSDLAISIDTSKLSEFTKYNCAFTLIVNSNGDHVINLENCDIQQIQVWRGVTKISFTHLLGAAQWRVKILQVGNQVAEYVRPTGQFDIPNSGYYGVATSQLANYTGAGCQIFAYSNITTPETLNTNNWYIYWMTGSIELYTVFPAPFLLTEWRMHVSGTLTYNFPTSITIYGSNDYENWNEVFSAADITYTVSQEIKRFTPTVLRPYRAYKWVLSRAASASIDVVPISLIGYKCPKIGNLNFYRYPKISDATSGYELSVNTEDGINVNWPLYNCVNTDQSSSARAEFIRTSSDVPIKITYKLPQAVRFEGFVVRDFETYYKWYCNGWFKWEGSNDGVTWTRLCELRKPFGDINISYMWFMYMCHTQGTYNRFRITVYTVYNEQENDLLTCGLFPIYTIPNEYRQFDTIVPVMESDTQEGYTVSSSSVTSGYTYNMYDANDTTYCQGAISDGQWITLIDMGESVVVKGFQLQAASDNYTKMPITFSIQGSTDNDSWQLLQSYALGAAGWSANSQIQSFTVSNTTGYRYYRIVVTAVQDGGTDVRIAGLGWSSAAGQPPIAYYVDEYIVPVMSSDSQDGYIATCSSTWSAETPAYAAFDRNADTLWNTRGKVDQWLQIQLPTAQSANILLIVARSDGYLTETPNSFDIKASNDGSEWTTLTTQSNLSWSLGETKSFNLNNTTPYLYYKFVINGNGGGNNCAIAEFSLMKRIYHND